MEEERKAAAERKQSTQAKPGERVGAGNFPTPTESPDLFADPLPEPTPEPTPEPISPKQAPTPPRAPSGAVRSVNLASLGTGRSGRTSERVARTEADPG